MIRFLLIAGLAASTSALAEPAPLVERMAGSYEQRSGNRLEIVPHGTGTAYFALSLAFANGHECNISGIALAFRDALTYESPGEGGRCTLTLRHGADGIRIYEGANEACRSRTCGARGGYGVEPGPRPSFRASERRPITDLARLRASEEYKAALREHSAPRR